MKTMTNHNRLSDIINSIIDWEIDLQGCYTVIAGCVDEIFGYRIEELLGKNKLELMVSTEAERWHPIWQDIVAHQMPFKHLYYAIQHRDGSNHILLTSGVPVFNQDGTLRGFRGTDRDVTTEKTIQDQLQEQGVQLQAIFDHSFVGIMLLTKERVITRANQRLAHILGYQHPRELIGLSVQAIHISDAHFNEFGQRFYAQLKQHPQTHIEYQLRRKDGSAFHCLISGKALDANIPSDLSKGVIWIIDDIEDFKYTERALRESEARYRALFESSSEGMAIIREGRFASMNLTARRLFGLEHVNDNDELSPANLSPLLQPDGQNSALKAQQMMMFALQNGSHRFEWQHRHRDGKCFQVEVSLTRIHIEDETALLSTMRDLSYQYEIDYLSYHDQLTHLPNANLLRDRLAQTIKFAAFSQTKVVALTLDLDGFKHVMDAHQHDIWEQVLKTQAARLAAHTPFGTLVARTSGDVFTVILDEVNDQQQAIQHAQRIQEGLHKPLLLNNGQELYMTECIGIAFYPDDATDANELLRKAGSALHKAKDLGPGSIMRYEPEMTLCSTNRLQLLQQLRQAVQFEEFELHFQPKINLTTARIIGGEALIRWRRADGRLVSPAEFIPIVESSDLVHSVGRWVLYAALQHLQQWTADGVPVVPISINIAGPQFARGTLPEEIASALTATGVAPALLQIELLESQLLSDPEQTRRQLNAIRALGVSVALDDFGTGYSSLSYLSRFPVDFLKIDRSFIRHLTENTGNLAIVRATLAMARGLDIETVAEGVETADEVTLLHRLGCHLVQGYFTGKPQPATDFAHLISTLPELALPAVLFRLITHGVLLVEDDPLQRHLFMAQLHRHGFAVFAVETAESVWEVLATEDIEAVVTDYRLPGMDGVTLLQQIRERHPEVARIMLSAASEANIPAAAINRGGVFRYLTKPCRAQDLCDAVRDGIHLTQMMRQSRHYESR